MKRKELISVRVSKTLVQTIDLYAASQKYLNRSRCIENALVAVFECTSTPEIEQILNCYDPYSEGLEIIVKKNYIKK